MPTFANWYASKLIEVIVTIEAKFEKTACLIYIFGASDKTEIKVDLDEDVGMLEWFLAMNVSIFEAGGFGKTTSLF